MLVGRRVTDPTSGFQALNRRAIALFAADYPHDYPGGRGDVLMPHKHGLRMTEVPVEMRERAGGRSSIGSIFAVYYMVKVLLALFVGLFRRRHATGGRADDAAHRLDRRARSPRSACCSSCSS